MNEVQTGSGYPESTGTAQKPNKRLIRNVGRGVIWFAGLLSLTVILLLVGASYYTTTSDFRQRIGKEVVGVLEESTGGKVELGMIKFNLWHLAIEADGLVIHGLEAPSEAPYLSAKQVLVRLKVISFLQHTAGAGLASHIGLNLLRVESPHVHLIIDKDGKTNQPIPKHPTPSTKPLQDTLLDLRAGEVYLDHGVAQVNDRAIPFSLAAQDLKANIHYLSKTDRYGVVVDLRDLRTQMAKEPEIKSSLHLQVEVGRDMAALTAFDFHSGDHSELQASAALNHFAAPEWQAKVIGSFELKQLQYLAGIEGLEAGSLDLTVDGHNCYVAPAAAQKKPRFTDRLRVSRQAQTTAPKTLPPDPNCQAGYLLVGSVRTHGAAYRNQYVRVQDVNAAAQLRVTPSQLLFTALTGGFQTGGSATGELKIDNWLGEVSGSAEKASATVKGAKTTANKTALAVSGQQSVPAHSTVTNLAPAHAYLTVIVDRIPLRTIMAISAPKNYGDLGFDTSVNGPLKVEWGGPAANISNTVQVQADLKLVSTGSRLGGDIPVTGQVVGHYDGAREVVNIATLTLDTPASSLRASGVLGVSSGDPLTAINVDLAVRNFAEFDRLLTTLGVAANGERGAKAIPVDLHGNAIFHGTARGALAELDVRGHIAANNLEVRMGKAIPAPSDAVSIATTSTASDKPVPSPAATDIHIDSLVADAEYTPRGLAVGSSTITQGSAVLHVAGSFQPRAFVKRGLKTYVWDNGTAINASIVLANANVVDLLTIAGQQSSVALTGLIQINGHTAGTLKNLGGSGSVLLTNGVAYGEPYEQANLNISVQGQEVEVSRIALRLHGMSIVGAGGYDLGSKHLHGHLQGSELRLSKFKTVQNLNLNADGIVSLNVDANGTAEQPNLKAKFKLVDVTVQGKLVGGASIDAHSEGKTVFYSLRSDIVGAQVNADGQTDLTGNYETRAKLTVDGLDVQTPLTLFAPGATTASSVIAGTVTISGPAKDPLALTGQAVFSSFSVKTQGVLLQTQGPLQLGLHNGLATLDAVHITGPDTDLRVSGSAQVLGATDPETGQPSSGAGKLDVKALGGINLALVHTLDPDLIASGKVVFSVGAGGVLSQPALNGNVQLQDVNAAVNGVPNGLSNMNGTLVFSGDRLTVQTLSATTGGGQLKLGGFITYRGGLYADLTAEGDLVRVRLYGLSGTANAKLRLQGGPQSLLLSGSVLLTRFGVGPDVDFAAFASSGGVSAPPDPAAAPNKIRMDVHVTSSPQLDFQNSYAKLAGTVDLTVRGTVANPTVLGRIQVTDGSATFAGTKYQLQRGNVYFSNPVRIDPTVDLDATARVENYDVTVGLHGTASNLKTTYRSEPPLTEADIFSLLALGRTQEESQIQSEQEQAAGTDPTTNALLGGALSATVGNRVSKLFGGAQVKIDPAFVGTLGGSSARITVVQQLTRQITLTYATNVNYSSEQLIQVAYQLSPSTSVVATRDETGVFSIVYKLRRRYR